MKRRFLRDAWFLTYEGIWYLLRVREVLLWTFLMPLIFFYFIGLVNSGGSPDAKDNLAVMAAPNAGFLADDLIERLGSRDYNIFRPKTEEEFLRFRRRLTIPAGFTDSVLAGHPMKIGFARTGQDLNADYDQVRLSRAVYTTLADLIVVSRKGAATPEAFRQLAAEPRTLTLEVTAAGKRLTPPSGYDQSVPGSMVMFTLMVLFTTGAVSLTIDRKLGGLRRLASTPMARGAIVLGRWGSRMALGMLQILFAMVVGTLLFHVHWGPHVAMVVVVLMAYGGMAAALALVLGNFVNSEGQVIGLGVILSNVMAGLGGCWWPIEVTPLWTQKLALFFPTGWAMDALHKLVNFGAPPSSVIPHLCAFVATGLVAGWVLSRSFRFQ